MIRNESIFAHAIIFLFCVMVLLVLKMATINQAVSGRYSAQSNPLTPGIGQCYDEVAEDFNELHERLVDTRDDDLEDAKNTYDTAVDVAWGDLDESEERIARLAYRTRDRSDRWADLGEMALVWLTLWHDLSLAERFYNANINRIRSEFSAAQRRLDTQKGWADLDCIVESNQGISDSAEQNSDLPSYPPGSVENSLENIPAGPVGKVTVEPVT